MLLWLLIRFAFDSKCQVTFIYGGNFIAEPSASQVAQLPTNWMAPFYCSKWIRMSNHRLISTLFKKSQEQFSACFLHSRRVHSDLRQLWLLLKLWDIVGIIGRSALLQRHLSIYSAFMFEDATMPRGSKTWSRPRRVFSCLRILTSVLPSSNLT